LVVRLVRQARRILRQARRDIIDIWSRIVLEIVHCVDAAARPFLDRTPRLVILLSAFLVAQAPGRRWRTEVGAAIAASSAAARRGTAGAAREAATARARSTESTPAATEAAASATTAGSRTAEAAAGTGPEASRTGWTRPTILSGARLADGEWPALKWLRVELADDFFGLLTIHELHKRKSAWTSGLAIDRHGDVGRLCDGREVGAEIRLTRTIGEVPDEQTDCQGLLVKSPLSEAGFDSISKTPQKSQRAKVKGKGQRRGRRNNDATSRA
jgi:hypothetical protein